MCVFYVWLTSKFIVAPQKSQSYFLICISYGRLPSCGRYFVKFIRQFKEAWHLFGYFNDCWLTYPKSKYVEAVLLTLTLTNQNHGFILNNVKLNNGYCSFNVFVKSVTLKGYYIRKQFRIGRCIVKMYYNV